MQLFAVQLKKWTKSIDLWNEIWYSVIFSSNRHKLLHFL